MKDCTCIMKSITYVLSVFCSLPLLIPSINIKAQLQGVGEQVCFMPTHTLAGRVKWLYTFITETKEFLLDIGDLIVVILVTCKC